MVANKSHHIAVIFALTLLFLSFSCKSYSPLPTTVTQVTPATSPTTLPQQDYVLGSGDSLDIKFFYQPELNETVSIRPDGKISLQLIEDEVDAAGMTPASL